MQRISVNSSNISSIGYGDSTQILEIEFHSGDIYRYSIVPSLIYQGLLNAVSKGQYFIQNIKDVYPATKLR